MAEGKKKDGYGMEGTAFGLADGAICFLGIIIGVAQATQDVRLVMTADIVGGFVRA